RQLAKHHEPLKSFHASGHGSTYYFGGPMEELATAQQLLEYLRSGAAAGACVYAVMPNTELDGIDPQLRASNVSYFVVDTTSSRSVLLSSCLPPGERDQNPLRSFVQTTPPPPPKRVVHADFEGKVELLGVDVPDRVSRLTEGKFAMILYFRVKDRMPAGYRI